MNVSDINRSKQSKINGYLSHFNESSGQDSKLQSKITEVKLQIKPQLEDIDEEERKQITLTPTSSSSISASSENSGKPDTFSPQTNGAGLAQSNEKTIPMINRQASKRPMKPYFIAQSLNDLLSEAKSMKLD